MAAIGETFAVTLSVFLARRFLDKQSLESLGLKVNRQAFFDLLTGIGITFVQMGLIFLAMLGLGWLRFTGSAWNFDAVSVVAKNTLWFLLIFVLVGWNEELLARGYHLQTIASGLNLLWGVIISSTAFGLWHLGNPNANLASVVGIFFAGLSFAYAYLRTKQLWLPIGLHAGWNIFQRSFGFPVSGYELSGLLKVNVSGPELWTGGAFGPEAGLITLPIWISIGVVIVGGSLSAVSVVPLA